MLYPAVSPIAGTSHFLGLRLSDREYSMLLEARAQGIRRGVSLLAKMKCDWEAVLWEGAGSAASIGGSKGGEALYPTDSGNLFSSPLADAVPAVWESLVPEESSASFELPAKDAPAGISKFLLWALKKAVSKLKNNEWVQRFLKLVGLTVGFVAEVVKRKLLSGQVLASLIPFYGSLKNLIVGGIKAYHARQDDTALDRLRAAAPQIGSGIPTVMFERFDAFLVRELALSAGKAAYNFGKGIASVLVAIFTAAASSALEFVTSIVEAVASFFYMAYQAITFQKATDKCREWVKYGDVARDLDLADGVAACPFLGCLFFGGANYIGHFNLTAMLTDERYLQSANLIQAVSEVSMVQRIACQYVVRTKFPFKTIDDKDQWLVTMMSGLADSSPRSEFVTDDASAAVKFAHYGKKALRAGKKVAKKVFGF
jgi:hypothetical protein